MAEVNDPVSVYRTKVCGQTWFTTKVLTYCLHDRALWFSLVYKKGYCLLSTYQMFMVQLCVQQKFLPSVYMADEVNCSAWCTTKVPAYCLHGRGLWSSLVYIKGSCLLITWQGLLVQLVVHQRFLSADYMAGVNSPAWCTSKVLVC